MSVSIRLAKYGKRNAPSYRVVVTPTRSKRSGKNIAIIGHFNPSDSTSEFTLEKDKYDYWVQNGAIVSQAVKELIDGTYEYQKYEPKKAGAKKEGGEETPKEAEEGADSTESENKETSEETPQEKSVEEPQENSEEEKEE